MPKSVLCSIRCYQPLKKMMNGSADRNFCTLKFLFGIAAHKGYLIIRQHQSLPSHATDNFRAFGQIDAGEVFEQNILLSTDDGQLLHVRRVKVCLKQPTRDGDREIFVLTNLPVEVASCLLVAQLYRRRWKLETLFQVLTETLKCAHLYIRVSQGSFVHLLYCFSRL